MCWYYYGGVNKNINKIDYNKIDNSRINFLPCNADDIIKNAENETEEYMIYGGYGMCDCHIKIGNGDDNTSDIKDMAKQFNEFKKCRDVKEIYFLKHWWKDKVEETVTFHIDDVDIYQFLADVEENILYKIQLFKRYY